jgi:hypothetical protein
MYRNALGIRIRLTKTIERPWARKDEFELLQMIDSYFSKWTDELHPLMEEVQLLAQQQVAVSAQEVLVKLGEFIDPMKHCTDLTGALFAANNDADSIDLRGMDEAREDLTREFVQFSGDLEQTHECIEHLRDAMRIELGLPPFLKCQIRSPARLQLPGRQ